MEMTDDKLLIVFQNTEKISMDSKRAGLCLSSCQNIVVDEQERLIACADCGRVLDPFEWLLRKANMGQAVLGELKTLREEVKSKRAELDRLKILVVNERDRLKRVNPAHELATTPAAKWRHAMAARKEA
jgi:hypothetical protein